MNDLRLRAAARLVVVAERGSGAAALAALEPRDRASARALFAAVDAALDAGHTVLRESDPSTPGKIAESLTDSVAIEARHAFDVVDRLAEGIGRCEHAAGELRLVIRRDGDGPVTAAGDADRAIGAAYVISGRAGSRGVARARSVDDERRLARALVQRLRGAAGEAAVADAAARQARVVERALVDPLLLVTGGPGTGKTRTIARIVESSGAGDARRVHVMAPTGRAAARLREQIDASASGAPTSSGASTGAAVHVSTIHAALRWRPEPGAPFAHTREDPLPTDLVIVDECSMVDLALMRRLIEAVPASAGLVLVGDADQLASVEAGSVFADLCTAGPMASASMRLEFNFRTAGDPRAAWLESVVAALRADDAEAVIRALRAEGALIDPGVDRLTRRAVEIAAPLYDAIIEETRHDALAAFDALRRFRLLGAVRGGDGGVESIAVHLDGRLARGRGPIGRHVMILENDREANLANGDLGVVTERGAVIGRRADGTARIVPIGSLPMHESAWAMSIHKSQGSEFDRVLVVLPKEASPILSRELLYTALTRSRGRVEVLATEASVRRAVARPVRRATGLADEILRLTPRGD